MRQIENYRMSRLTNDKFKIQPFSEPTYMNFQGRKETDGGLAQSTFLMTRPGQEKKFLEAGYVKGRPGDFGIISSKVVDPDTPVYQTNSDSYNRDDLTYVGSYGLGYSDDTQLYHAGSHAGELYMTSNGTLVDRKLDYNNYGMDADGSTGAHYEDQLQKYANYLDKMGSPVVVSSGYQPVRNPMFNMRDINTNNPLTINDILEDRQNVYANEQIIKLVEEFAKKNNMQNYNGEYLSTLPEVVIQPKKLVKRKKK